MANLRAWLWRGDRGQKVTDSNLGTVRLVILLSWLSQKAEFLFIFFSYAYKIFRRDLEILQTTNIAAGARKILSICVACNFNIHLRA